MPQMRTTNDLGKYIQMLQNIFKYININKQREASISFKHLQINTFFKTFLIPNFQSAGADLITKKKGGEETARDQSGQHKSHNMVHWACWIVKKY